MEKCACIHVKLRKIFVQFESKLDFRVIPPTLNLMKVSISCKSFICHNALIICGQTDRHGKGNRHIFVAFHSKHWT